MIPPTIRPDPLAIVDVALGLGLVMFAYAQRPVLYWVLSFLGGMLVWAGVIAAVSH